MGIPRMFRWLSERYPLCSQLIEENNIPEFDNLYLDMNGIIHNATHANKGSHQVLNDEEMYTSIFAYIEDLFNKIKPKKLFYMAVDGVAPRAKMNQQRSRRFRTAMDREKDIAKAKKSGVQVSEDAFDSNCITPGTVFMEKLTGHLKYFIHKKTTDDIKWRDIDIILSSHEVPGEGEHKIMEYIRVCKAQADYDPNLRHCLYGLDADLIMLGLLSHEPHFALLREEVQFGRPSEKVVSHAPPRFFLLHLSLVREYLEMDFVFDRSQMKFPFDVERVIDDFVMMVMFVGNDFLPHLPGFDIGEGVLTGLFEAYSQWLVTGDGYINHSGTINFRRLDQFLRTLNHREYGRFLSLPGNENLLRNAHSFDKELTTRQRQIVEDLKHALSQPSPLNLSLPGISSYKDVMFLKDLANEFKLDLVSDYLDNKDNEHDEVAELQYRIIAKSSSNISRDDDKDKDDTLADSHSTNFDQAFNSYLRLPVVGVEDEQKESAAENEVFQEWKKTYYRGKLNISLDDPAQLQKLVQCYAEGVQWVMYYYYRGIPSWGWYFPYHYAPMLSDLINLGSLKIHLNKGQPFLPFEQLMGVLPARSKNLVPAGFRELMTNPSSPIIDFYPMEFQTDPNGKKQDWEAIVLIPFIEETRLLAAMDAQSRLLTEAEKLRNRFGEPLLFRYTTVDSNKQTSSHNPVPIRSTFPGYFPDLLSACQVKFFQLPPGPANDEFEAKLCPGVLLGISSPCGFPTLHALSHKRSLSKIGVQVFEMASKNESILLTLKNIDKEESLIEIANEYLDQSVQVGFPYLQEAKVVQVEGSEGVYFKQGDRVVHQPHSQPNEFDKEAHKLRTFYRTKKAIVTGEIRVLFKVAPFVRLVQNFDGSLSKKFQDNVSLHAICPRQLVVTGGNNERHLARPVLPLPEEFPIKTQILFLGDGYYGVPGRVIGYNQERTNLNLTLVHHKEPANPALELTRTLRGATQHLLLRDLARQLKLPPSVISRITSTIKLSRTDPRSGNSTNYNVGLGLKFEGKGLMVLECCRRSNRGWEFTPAGCALITAYCFEFPQLMDYLANEQDYSPIIPAELVYPNHDNLSSQLEHMKNWLKEQKVDQFKLVPLDSEALDQGTVGQLVNFWDTFYKQPAKLAILDVKNISRTTLLHPSFTPQLQLNRQRFDLGQRVVFAQLAAKVPLGIRGTIIGRQSSGGNGGDDMLEVLFDRTFSNGTDLGGRCPPHRGLWISTTTVLNLDRPQLTPSKVKLFFDRGTVSPPRQYQRKNNNNNNPGSGNASPLNSPRPNSWNTPKSKPGLSPNLSQHQSQPSKLLTRSNSNKSKDNNAGS